MTTSLSRCRWLWGALGFITLVYLLAFSLSAKDVFWSPDEGARLFHIQTLQWDNGLTYQIPYPGHRLDPDYRFYPYDTHYRPIYPHPLPGGQVGFHWPIWFFLISLPFYQLFGLPGLYIIPLLSGLFITAVSGWITYRLMPRAAPMAMIVVGLATPIFIYSLLFWEHTLVVLLGLVALGLVMAVGQTRARRRWLPLLLAALCLAGATAMRLEMIFFALALLLAVGVALAQHDQSRQILRRFFSRTWRWQFIGGAVLLAVLLWLAVQRPLLANQLIPRYMEHISTAIKMLNEPNTPKELAIQVPEFLISTGSDFGPSSPPLLVGLGFIGLVLSGAAVFAPDRFRIWLLVTGGLLMGLVSLYVFFQPARYRIHSLFLPAPHLIFMFLALNYARQQQRFETTVLVATAMLYFVLGTMGVMLRGGVWFSINTEWGPRYILMFYPLAGICATLGGYHFYQSRRAAWKKRLWLALCALLVLIGLEFSLRGWSEVQTTKDDMLAYAAVLESAEQPVVTDLYWLPGLLATRFVEQEIYALPETADLGEWVRLAAGQQVGSFLLVTATPLETDIIRTLSPPVVLARERLERGLIFAEYQILPN